MLTAIVSGGAGVVACGLAGLYMYTRLTRGVCKATTDLSGKTAIVTGANTGIGYCTATDFARRNGRVIVAGRTKEKIEKAAAAIRDETSNPNVVPMILDVSRMKSVRSFVEEFLKKENQLDILVNNAGVTGLEFTRTDEGLEVTMATNHLGHFLLTNLLLDMLKKSAPSRVVTVSSDLHHNGKIDLDNLNSEKRYPKENIYSTTKLCNIFFTKELARRLEGTGVTTYTLHPGAVMTDIWRNVKFPFTLVLKFLMIFLFKTSEEGAQTTIYCAVAPGIEEHSGGYFSDCRLTDTYNNAKDDALAKKLWDVSERLTGMVTKDQ